MSSSDLRTSKVWTRRGREMDGVVTKVATPGIVEITFIPQSRKGKSHSDAEILYIFSPYIIKWRHLPSIDWLECCQTRSRAL